MSEQVLISPKSQAFEVLHWCSDQGTAGFRSVGMREDLKVVLFIPRTSRKQTSYTMTKYRQPGLSR